MTGFPFLWIVLAAVCSNRRKEAIGGWLLFFHITSFTSLIALFPALAINHEAYLPAAWAGEMNLYALFLLSTLPGLVGVPMQLFFAERLRHRRKKTGTMEREHMLRQLRGVLIVVCVFDWFALGVDALYFEENLVWSLVALPAGTLWPLYFVFSKRVRAVYLDNNWVDGVGIEGLPVDDKIEIDVENVGAGGSSGAPVGLRIQPNDTASR